MFEDEEEDEDDDDPVWTVLARDGRKVGQNLVSHS